MRSDWELMLKQRDAALARRHAKRGQDLVEHTRKLRTLEVGETVAVQNQKGNDPKRWGCTGKIVEIKKNDQYVVKLDGSGRLTLRNRKFLKPLIAYKDDLKVQEEQNAAELEKLPRRSGRLAGKNIEETAVSAMISESEVSVFRPWE